MEIQLVHTTGSPSRHDSDSESSYDKKQQMKSSSEMALHRKQSRRCKKQMSERQRRKRMNNSMDKLGLLVYGKTFKDGLKVDKATLLKDAYEKLQTMKDDYHKGYETAITSTQTFLDRLDGCPQDVKDALNRHLNNTLRVNLHRCHSTTSVFPVEESNSDSNSPQPLRSASLEAFSGQDYPVNLQKHCPQSMQSPKKFFMAEAASEKDAAVTVSTRSNSRVDSSLSQPRLAEPQRSLPSRTMAQVAPLPRCSVSADTSSSRCDAEGSEACKASEPVAQTAGSPLCVPLKGSQRGSWSSLPSGTAGIQRQDLGGTTQYPHHTYPSFPYLSYTSKVSPPTPKISPYVTPFAPQNPLYLGSTPPSLVYGAHLASSPSRMAYTIPEAGYSGSRFDTQPYSTLHHPLPAHSPARYGGPSKADDSGYISPVVPSPHTPVNSSIYGSLKKRYLRQMMSGSKGKEVDDTDEENDKEVEQVFSRSRKFDTDSPSSHSD